VTDPNASTADAVNVDPERYRARELRAGALALDLLADDVEGAGRRIRDEFIAGIFDRVRQPSPDADAVSAELDGLANRFRSAATTAHNQADAIFARLDKPQEA
jgi:hypothetical protein